MFDAKAKDNGEDDCRLVIEKKGKELSTPMKASAIATLTHVSSGSSFLSNMNGIIFNAR